MGRAPVQVRADEASVGTGPRATSKQEMTAGVSTGFTSPAKCAKIQNRGRGFVSRRCGLPRSRGRDTRPRCQLVPLPVETLAAPKACAPCSSLHRFEQRRNPRHGRRRPSRSHRISRIVPQLRMSVCGSSWRVRSVRMAWAAAAVYARRTAGSRRASRCSRARLLGVRGSSGTRTPMPRCIMRPALRNRSRVRSSRLIRTNRRRPAAGCARGPPPADRRDGALVRGPVFPVGEQDEPPVPFAERGDARGEFAAEGQACPDLVDLAAVAVARLHAFPLEVVRVGLRPVARGPRDEVIGRGGEHASDWLRLLVVGDSGAVAAGVGWSAMSRSLLAISSPPWG
jgi:hypothetical protein